MRELDGTSFDEAIADGQGDNQATITRPNQTVTQADQIKWNVDGNRLEMKGTRANFQGK